MAISHNPAAGELVTAAVVAVVVLGLVVALLLKRLYG